VSNRTDFAALAEEMATQYGLNPEARERVAVELRNAWIAGLSGDCCEGEDGDPALVPRTFWFCCAPCGLAWHTSGESRPGEEARASDAEFCRQIATAVFRQAGCEHEPEPPPKP